MPLHRVAAPDEVRADHDSQGRSLRCLAISFAGLESHPHHSKTVLKAAHYGHANASCSAKEPPSMVVVPILQSRWPATGAQGPG